MAKQTGKAVSDVDYRIAVGANVNMPLRGARLQRADRPDRRQQPAIPVKVTPRRRNLFCWNNMDALGQPNTYAMHQGMPVTAGTKYIITKWYRERPRPYS